MKKCDTCIYRNENEYHKPCIVYRDDCEYYEEKRGDMTRDEAIHIIDNLKPTNTKSSFDAYVVGKAITMAIKALEQEKNIKALGEDMRIMQKAIKNKKVLIGFNLAVAICNKHLGEGEEV